MTKLTQENIFLRFMDQHTQLQIAKTGEISSAVKAVAEDEHRSKESIREGVAAGRIVIPANHHHSSLRPIGIGRTLRTKINANLGNSAMAGDYLNEQTKLEIALKYGADTVMDLSTGANISKIRHRIIKESRAPVGTVPLYEAVSRIEEIEELTPELLLTVIEEQAREGVDYMTIHAGLLREHLPSARKRLLGIVSRGGALTAQWMTFHQRQNPTYEYFPEILALCLQHDVTLSLGDGLRPGCLADASDDAQFAELKVLGELVSQCRAAGVQAMVEGPGHIPMDQIQMNMEKERELCDDAPFYILGPVVTDCAPGYDHITSAIGAAWGAFHGAAMLCYVTPKEHLGLPNAEDVRAGVTAYKIAAHAADIGKGLPGSRDRDDAISRARSQFDWNRQFDLALDPEHARRLRHESIQEYNVGQNEKTDEEAKGKSEYSKYEAEHRNSDTLPYCTMCGPKFCSMRVSGELAKDEETRQKTKRNNT